MNLARTISTIAQAVDSCLGAGTSMARTPHVSMRMKNILLPSKRNVPRGMPAILGTAAFTTGLAISAYGAAQSKPDVPFRPGSTSHAKWPNGAEVEVLGFGDGTSSQLPGWKLDGSPVSIKELAKGTSFSADPPGRDKRDVTVFFKLSNLPPGAAGIEFMNSGIALQLAGCRTNGGGGSFGGGAAELNRSFIIPSRLRNADFRVGLGEGEFKPAMQWPDAKKQFTVELKPVEGRGGVQEKAADGSSKLVPTTFVVSQATCEVPASLLSKDWRLTVYGKNGEVLKKAWFSPGMPLPAKNRGQIMGQIPVPPNEVSKIVLETRNYQWVTIKGLPMVSKSHAND